MKSTCIVILLALVGPVCSTQVRHDRALLGGHTLGERLSYFKGKFPGSVCGTPFDPRTINRKTLDDPDDSGWLSCCVDDAQQLSSFTQFKILSVGQDCHLSAGFHNERLQSLHYRVDVNAFHKMVLDLVKAYGPPTERKDFSLDGGADCHIVAWWVGYNVLELNSCVVDEKELNDSVRQKTGSPQVRVLDIDIWRLEL